MATETRKRWRRPSLHLQVDGCNGNIRFSQHRLKNPDKRKWNDVLSMTRCTENFQGGSGENSGCSSKRKQKKTGKRNGGIIPPSQAYESLDVIPLFQKLSSDEISPFNTFSIIFDGASRNQRATEATDADSSTIKEWIVDKNIRIEITGLYDETDNVLVDRVKKWSCSEQLQQSSNELDELTRMLESTSLSPKCERLNEESSGLYFNTNGCTTTTTTGDASCVVTVLKRSSMGPGKGRTILQPLGLLRPESVSCFFSRGFASVALECEASNTLTRKLNHPRLGSNLITLKKDLVLTCKDPPSLEDRNREKNKETSHGYPVIVTDDVFLRQRVMEHGGLVMTFHQLWILLTELQADIDKQDRAKTE